MTCPLFCEFFMALIAKEFDSALCFLVLLKKSLSFSSFFSFCFWFLNAVSILPHLLWHLWRFRVHNSCCSCLVVVWAIFSFESFREMFRLCFFLLRRTFFSLYPFCRFFVILREIFLTSLG